MEDTCGVCAGIFFYLGYYWFTSGKEKVYNKTKVSLNQNNCIYAKNDYHSHCQTCCFGLPEAACAILGHLTMDIILNEMLVQGTKYERNVT
ncbi:hypothetical protein MHB54_17540 [Paenibacillus sp. FSL M7-0802]|uniref:hypothetical protein n=1 Tax=Paenibacillus sp. FSL M7-0802 TaxID=2921536 RepID=UPI0030F653A9